MADVLMVHEASRSRVKLAELDRKTAAERGRAGAICLVPAGSLEQHGWHLPIGTDSMLVEHVSLRAAELAQRDVIVAPTVWTGLSPHHVRLGVTVTLEPELLLQLVRSIVGSLRGWFADVVIVNGHGGNRGWLGALAIVDSCLVVDYWEMGPPGLLEELLPADLGSIGHGGQVETSAMLAAAPGLVARGPAAFDPILRLADPLLQPDMGLTGVLGDPGAAGLEAGELFLSSVTEGLARLLDSLAVKDTSDLKGTTQ
jgi:creatinine amidohydrolase